MLPEGSSSLGGKAKGQFQEAWSEWLRWEESRLTMDSHYEAEEVRALADIADNGLLYRGKKTGFLVF